MAKCEKRELKPEPPPVEYVLTLSDKELEALLQVLWHRPALPCNATAGGIHRAIMGLITP